MSVALLVLMASIAVQLSAAVAALRLIRVTGSRAAWSLIAAAISLMAVRRVVTLAGYLGDAASAPLDPAAEAIALLVSLFMLAGLLAIGPLFRSLRESHDRIHEAEQRASRQAAELASANTALEVQVTEREHAEALARAHAEALGRSLAQLTEEPHLDRFLRSVLTVVVERLDASGGAIWLRDEQTGATTLAFESGRRSLDGRFTPEDALFPRARGLGSSWHPPEREERAATLVWRSGLDTSWLAPEEVRLLEGLGAKRALLTPMLVNDRPIGWFVIRFVEPEGGEDARQLELVEALVRPATLALQLERYSRRAEETAVLRERNRLAREIHDTLAQGFTGILMQLEAAEAQAPQLPEAAARHLARIRELARAPLVEARRSVWALRPLVLENRGLVASVRHVAQEIARDRGGDVRVEASGNLDAVPLDVQCELVRIAQECITNALEHGAPGLVEVELSADEGATELRVRDDGRGMGGVDLGSGQRGFGLMGMRDRAERLGGRFEIETGDAGTTVLARIPAVGPELRVR